jgi:2,3-bisphosphoglycerate-independent phosphoglycerate mutase
MDTTQPSPALTYTERTAHGMPKEGDLVQVHWTDPCSHSGKYDRKKHTLAAWDCVGWVVEVDTIGTYTCLVISAHENHVPDAKSHFEDVLVVPICLIDRVEVLQGGF